MQELGANNFRAIIISRCQRTKWGTVMRPCKKVSPIVSATWEKQWVPIEEQSQPQATHRVPISFLPQIPCQGSALTKPNWKTESKGTHWFDSYKDCGDMNREWTQRGKIQEKIAKSGLQFIFLLLVTPFYNTLKCWLTSTDLIFVEITHGPGWCQLPLEWILMIRSWHYLNPISGFETFFMAYSDVWR